MCKDRELVVKALCGACGEREQCLIASQVDHHGKYTYSVDGTGVLAAAATPNEDQKSHMHVHDKVKLLPWVSSDFTSFSKLCLQLEVNPAGFTHNSEYYRCVKVKRRLNPDCPTCKLMGTPCDDKICKKNQNTRTRNELFSRCDTNNKIEGSQYQQIALKPERYWEHVSQYFEYAVVFDIPLHEYFELTFHGKWTSAPSSPNVTDSTEQNGGAKSCSNQLIPTPSTPTPSTPTPSTPSSVPPSPPVGYVMEVLKPPLGYYPLEGWLFL